MDIAVRSRYDFHETAPHSKEHFISQLNLIKAASEKGGTLSIGKSSIEEVSSLYALFCTICSFLGMKNPTHIHLVDREIIHQLRIASSCGYLKDTEIQSLISEVTKAVAKRSSQVRQAFTLAEKPTGNDASYYALSKDLVYRNTTSFEPSWITSHSVRTVERMKLEEDGDVFLALCEKEMRNGSIERSLEYFHLAVQTTCPEKTTARRLSLLTQFHLRRDELGLTEKMKLSSIARIIAKGTKTPLQQKTATFLQQTIFSSSTTGPIGTKEEMIELGNTLIGLGHTHFGIQLIRQSKDKEALLQAYVQAARNQKGSRPDLSLGYYHNAIELLNETKIHLTTFQPWIEEYVQLSRIAHHDHRANPEFEKILYEVFSTTQSSIHEIHCRYEVRAQIMREKCEENRRAMSYMDMAIKLYPTVSEFHFLRGLVALASDESIKARNAFRKAHELDRTDPYYYYGSIGDDYETDYRGSTPLSSMDVIEISTWFTDFRMIDQTKSVYKRMPKPVYDLPIHMRYG